MEIIRFLNGLKVSSLTILVVALFCSCQNSNDRPLRIAVAANQMYVIDTLVNVFEKMHQTKCDVILGPSARLMTQINQGAPYDVYLCADKKYTDKLVEIGLSLDTPRAYSTGELIAIFHGSNEDLESLTETTNEKVAMPNPEIAPYGVAAQKALEDRALWNRIKNKIVLGESVAQTNQFFLSGNVEAAITSKSILYGPEEVLGTIRKGQTESLGTTVTHYGMVVNHGNTHVKAKDFFSFILSPEGQAILKRHGYLSPE